MTAAHLSAFGKYRTIALLGQGGMARVYLTANAGLGGVNKLVVVKQLRPEIAESAARDMFLDEARLASLLSHPNVVQTFEVCADSDSLYLTMEFLEGQPLDRLLYGPERARFTPNALLRVVADALAGLHYAHELTDFRGNALAIVHRDVSPHNIFITYDGHVKLVDFGIAKAAGMTSRTETGVFKGKVRYAAPEQILTLSVDRRADVFAMGVIVWEIATGRRMWENRPDTAVMTSLVSGDIPQARTLLPDMDEELGAICSKALASVPAERYASADEFRNAILEYLSRPSETRNRNELSLVMSQVFANERSALRQLIDEQLREIAYASGGTVQVRTLESVRVPLSNASRGDHVGSSAFQSAASVASMPRAAPGWARRYAAAGGLLAAVAGMVSWSLSRGAPSLAAEPLQRLSLASELSLPTSAASEGSTLPSTENPDRADSNIGRSIRVQISGVPPEVKLYLDETLLPSNPIDMRVPAESLAPRVHRLTGRAAGFETKEIRVAFDHDLDESLILMRVHSAPLAATTAPRGRPSVVKGSLTPAASAAPPSGLRALDELDPYR